MGIFNNTIGDVGTAYKQSLEERLHLSSDSPLAESIPRNLANLSGEGIRFVEGHSFTFSADEVLSSVETIFHYNGNSSGYNGSKIKSLAENLNGKGYKTKKDTANSRLIFTKEENKTEIWIEKDNVGIRMGVGEFYDKQKFREYLTFCEDMYNLMIGSAGSNDAVELEKREKEPPIQLEPAEPLKPDINVGDYQNITNEWFKDGTTIEIEYDSRTIRIQRSPDPDKAPYAFANIDLEGNELDDTTVGNYKAVINRGVKDLPLFDSITKIRGKVNLKSDIEGKTLDGLNALVKRLVMCYDALPEVLARNYEV